MAARSASYALMMEEKPGLIVSAKQNTSMRRPSKWVIALVVFLGILAVTLVILQFCIKRSSSSKTGESNASSPCTGNCSITLVESIPEGVKFPAGSVHNPSIYSGWMNLLKFAEEQIDIASFYWTLRGSDTGTSDPSTKQGENVFEEIQAAAERGTFRCFSSFLCSITLFYQGCSHPRRPFYRSVYPSVVVYAMMWEWIVFTTFVQIFHPEPFNSRVLKLLFLITIPIHYQANR